MAAVNIQYPIKLSPQPTNMTCWSAATTMLFGSIFSAGPGGAKTGAAGGLEADYNNIHEFAISYNLQLYPLQSWTMDGLLKILQAGPIAMMGALPSLHAVVIGGATGDGTADGTKLKIYDPWPPNIGSIYEITYADLMTTFPLATMYLLQRKFYLPGLHLPG